jgi:hypothetical protein
MTQVKNAGTLYKAHLIYTANGDLTKAAEYKTQALAINTNIDEQLLNATVKTQMASN